MGVREVRGKMGERKEQGGEKADAGGVRNELTHEGFRKKEDHGRGACDERRRQVTERAGI